MIEATVLQQLEELAERVGVKVLYESLDKEEFVVRSGACTLRGQLLAVIDRRLPLADRIRVLADCLARVDLSTIYLVPAVRELIDARRASTTPSEEARDGKDEPAGHEGLPGKTESLPAGHR